jgi:hypothetical protein
MSMLFPPVLLFYPDAEPTSASGRESAGTRRVYDGVLHALLEEFSAGTDAAALRPRPVAARFTSRWAIGRHHVGTPRLTRCARPPSRHRRRSLPSFIKRIVP